MERLSIGSTSLSVILGILAFICLCIAYSQKKETGAIFTNAWIWASAEKRAEMDDRIKKAEYRIGKNVFFLIAVMLILLLTWILFSVPWFIYIVNAFIVFIIVYAIVSYVQTTRLERSIISSGSIQIGKLNNNDSQNNHMGIAIAAIAFTLVAIPTLIIVFGLSFANAHKEPIVIVSDNNISIKGMYGQTVRYSDIDNIYLVELSMSELGTIRRIGGYTSGQIRTGNYISDELGEIILFVQSNASPTIWIERKSGNDIYISFLNNDDTRELFASMASKLNEYNGELYRE